MASSVSVIIPTFNYGRFIGEAIESVLVQSYPIAEIIVVDDGSTDETSAVLEAFGERVRVISGPNSGVGAARNKGFAVSNGDFIAFLDADDIWASDKIEKQMAAFDADTDLGLVHCGIREFDSTTGETLSERCQGRHGWVADELLLFESPVIYVSGSVWVVRREIFTELGGFDTRLKVGEDWEFCYRVARRAKIGFVPEALVNYRKHGKNAHLNIGEMERSTAAAWGKIFESADDHVVSLKRRSYGNLYKTLAGSYLHAGEYSGFARNLLRSIWFRPGFLGYYLTLPFARARNSSAPHDR
jgi:glycosyltransferase involved in cell wall biosynthesis